MVGIFFAVIFHQMLVLTESVVLHLELFLLGEKKNQPEKSRKRIFYFSERKCKIADLSCFMSPLKLIT